MGGRNRGGDGYWVKKGRGLDGKGRQDVEGMKTFERSWFGREQIAGKWLDLL